MDAYRSKFRLAYDTDRMRLDLAERGWEAKDLAAAAHVSEMTVYRFLHGQTQTVKTAKKLALALGRTPRTYLLKQDREKVAS